MKRRGEKLLTYVNNLGKNEQVYILFTYLFGVALGILPVLITLLLIPQARQPFYLLFLPAVTISAWYGGLRTNAVTTTIATVGIINFFFIPSFAYRNFFAFVELAMFIASALFIGFIIDLAKRTDLLSAYKRRERNIADLLIELEKENTKMKAEIKARDEFLSIASHELKTPITSIVLQLQRALHNISNVSLAHFSVHNLLKMLESAQEQTQRLTKMINDLLNFSLITTGRLQLEIEKVNLTQLVKHTVEGLREKAKREGYRIKLEAPRAVEGYWDKLRLEQVVINLLTNAIKYGNKKPIKVHVVKQGAKAILAVADGGIGISPEHQRKIFQRFERAVSSPEYEGLGVGLYITHQIVKAHGGTIKVESMPNKGSTFTVELPLRIDKTYKR